MKIASVFCVLDVAKFEQYLWITHWSKTSNSRNLVNFGRILKNKPPLEPHFYGAFKKHRWFFSIGGLDHRQNRE
jgi:hypothetical protein